MRQFNPSRWIVLGMMAAALCLPAGAAAPTPAQPRPTRKWRSRSTTRPSTRRTTTPPSGILGSQYKQHNPTAADGAEGLKGFIDFLKSRFPNQKGEIKRVIAEGDLVVLHVHSTRGDSTPGRAIVDIFRLENGKVVEHWDVIQDIPEKAANTNGMF